MKKRDTFEEDILAAYEKGELKSVASSKAQLRRYREAAQATFIKDRRVNIRLSSPDLMDIQARAMEEGMPYQTLIASVLHKFVSGKLVEKPSRLASRSSGTAHKHAAGTKGKAEPLSQRRPATKGSGRAKNDNGV